MKDFHSLLILPILFLIISPLIMRGQGCGDAGVCSINAIKPGEETVSTSKNSFRTGLILGHAQYNVFIFASYAEYSRGISQRLNGSLKITSSVHHGRLTTTYGLSDLFASMTYEVVSKLKLTGGIKHPFDKADKKKNNLPLPMSYQTGLGTTDILLGMTYSLAPFSAGLAFQQPIIQNNNQFVLSDYPAGEIDTNYLTTKGYHRQADILLRISYIHTFQTARGRLTGGILPIFHLGNDTYLNAAGKRVEIPHSNGLTFNLNLFYSYPVKDGQSIELSLGAPVISRKARPDGLSSISIGVQYKILL